MAETASQQLLDLWKKQMEDGTQAWLKMMGQGPPADPQAFWRPFMDPSMAAWSKVLTQGAASADLMAQWKQFVDQWIAAWSKALEQAMSTETFAQALGKQLEGFLNAGGPAKKAAEQQMEAGLSAFGVPSRSQVVSLAQQLVQLEDKVDGLEDRLDAILKRLAELAPTARGERS
jgi:polyhydroxyalkanoate synthesis regulator phasin